MEVRRAPLALQFVCDGWLLAVTALILTVYLSDPAPPVPRPRGRPDTRQWDRVQDGCVRCNKFALPMRERIAIEVL
jgi:hypothetical protein